MSRSDRCGINELLMALWCANEKKARLSKWCVCVWSIGYTLYGLWIWAFNLQAPNTSIHLSRIRALKWIHTPVSTIHKLCVCVWVFVEYVTRLSRHIYILWYLCRIYFQNSIIPAGLDRAQAQYPPLCRSLMMTTEWYFG